VHHHLETSNFLGDVVELDMNATITLNYGGFSNLESMFINHKFVFNSLDSLLTKVIISQNPYNGQNQRFMKSQKKNMTILNFQQINSANKYFS
jgi:hypothetical protein